METIPRIRTAAPKTRGTPSLLKSSDKSHLTRTKLLVRVLQDVVAHQRFETYGDLTAALKDRCATLRIPYDSGLVSEAIDRLELGGKQRVVWPRQRPQSPVEDPSPMFSRSEATALVTALRLRTPVKIQVI